VTSLIDFFDAAYLINLPERLDRRRAALEEFRRLDWHAGSRAVEIFPAIKPTDPCGFPSIAVRGCFLSHFDCLTRAHRAECRNVLIMEDDLTLAPSLPRLTPGLTSQLSTFAWDFVFLGHYYSGEIGDATARTDKVDFVAAPTQIRGTHFYCVSARVLPKLLEHLQHIVSGSGGAPEFGPMSIDGAFNTFRRLHPEVRTLIAVPKLGWQRFSPSDITPRRIDSVAVLRPLMRAYRGIKNFAKRRRV
jgi:glycosyl transferase family 25